MSENVDVFSSFICMSKKQEESYYFSLIIFLNFIEHKLGHV